MIKSSVQTVAENAPAIERTIAFQVRRLYRLGGWRVFFNGMETALLRSVPVNAVALYVYECTSDLLRADSDLE